MYAWAYDEWWATGASQPHSPQAEAIVVNPDTGWITGKDFQLSLSALQGDATGNGIVDLADVIHILQVLVKSTSSNSSPSGDTNGDNRLGIVDAVYLLQRLAQ
ncbi:MAG: hypothetical protein B6245_23000 [Desulfobacteraceae bacterium 4572_88]|nr:MAG: hypothetical protein B6245_23000 [Desulfobacteraceae bacterium 4572_88]